MRSTRFIVFWTLLLIASTVAAQPVVQSVPRDLINGQAITITGLGFGAKVPAAPLKWDNFDTGVPGEIIQGWQIDSAKSLYLPKYSTEVTRTPGSQSLYQHYMDGNYGCAVYIYPLPDFQKLYVSGWWYNEVGGAPSRNTKLINLSGGQGYSNVAQPQNRTDLYPSNPNGHLYATTRDGEEIGDYSLRGDLHSNEWMRMERYVDVGTINGGDGISWIKRNLQDWAEIRGTMYSDENKYTLLLITHYFAQDVGTPKPWMKSFWDELYVDTTPARVEIGDAPTWNACTHREIQVPFAWDNTGISFVVNRGTFPPNSSAYLYIVDGNGSDSVVGYPINIGEGDEDAGPPGVPGKPTRNF